MRSLRMLTLRRRGYAQRQLSSSEEEFCNAAGSRASIIARVPRGVTGRA